MASSQRYDYLVVGAGAAGCAVAARLSEDPTNRVMLIEAGGFDRHILLRIPSLNIFTTLLPQHQWDFHSEPVPALNDRRLQFNQGKGLGGSSSVNGMIYMRGNSREFDRWRDAGCEGWSFAEVLPFYKKSETNARGEGQWHGGSGPLKVRRARPQLGICDAFLAAAAEAGFPVLEDVSASNAVEGFGYFDVNIHRGRRISAATAYLKPARKRPNLTVMPNAPALRVVVEKGRATGVEIGRDGSRETISAEREVVLCSGSYNSPQLLMLSGIGPADHLRAHGIEPIVDAPEVGQNLRNHPVYSLRYGCSEPITVYRYLNPVRAIGAWIQFAMTGNGPVGETYNCLGGFFRTAYSPELADIIVTMAPGLIRRVKRGGKPWDVLPNQHGFQVSALVARPQSAGEIRLRSSDPAASPMIFPNYFAEPQDLRTLVSGVQRLREMMRGRSIAGVLTGELEQDANRLDDESLAEDIRDRSRSASHPMGTCRMGSDASSVVDPALRVRGVDGLRVADASIVPSALGACTHAPAIMIGEKAADLIRR